MKYIDEFRNAGRVNRVAACIRELAPARQIKIMEVCGTHTQSFFRFGLDRLLPEQLEFISGPGCPVCVSSQEYIDRAIFYAQAPDVTVLTFGDMLRVPGTASSLEREKARGARVYIVYSPLDALSYAARHRREKVIFLAVGFETTACTIAQAVIAAQKDKMKNIFFLPSLKTIPSAMKMLLHDRKLGISAFLCPGHVSAIIGMRPYAFIPRQYKIGCCIAGFEPLDILEGIYLLVRQIVHHRPAVENQYSRVVTGNGNVRAQKSISTVFTETSSPWRGLGIIPKSGLALKRQFARFDAQQALPVTFKHRPATAKQKLCRCGAVIKGLLKPDACPLFRKSCTPENAYGPCMVSSEGACNTYFRYRLR
jgi:hydrogenase expression/formation protein HypD